jgi:1-aminocyclopropane-1-carboxylate deaminase/D-cysteine desulfhydrase-like pyridoxal-dependent ACC family enzyme
LNVPINILVDFDMEVKPVVAPVKPPVSNYNKSFAINRNRVRVIVCGGRKFNKSEFLNQILNYFNETYNLVALAHGNATGADTLAKEWAEQQKDISVVAFPVTWINNSIVDKAAELKRNQEMLNRFKPDFVIAFEGGTGTADMIKKAKQKNVPVFEIK